MMLQKNKIENVEKNYSNDLTLTYIKKTKENHGSHIIYKNNLK